MQMGSNRVRKVSAGSSIQCVVCRHTSFDVLPVGHRYLGYVGRRPSKANLLQTRLRDNANGLLRFAGSRRRRASLPNFSFVIVEPFIRFCFSSSARAGNSVFRKDSRISVNKSAYRTRSAARRRASVLAYLCSLDVALLPCERIVDAFWRTLAWVDPTVTACGTTGFLWRQSKLELPWGGRGVVEHASSEDPQSYKYYDVHTRRRLLLSAGLTRRPSPQLGNRRALVGLPWTVPSRAVTCRNSHTRLPASVAWAIAHIPSRGKERIHEQLRPPRDSRRAFLAGWRDDRSSVRTTRITGGALQDKKFPWPARDRVPLGYETLAAPESSSSGKREDDCVLYVYGVCVFLVGCDVSCLNGARARLIRDFHHIPVAACLRAAGEARKVVAFGPLIVLPPRGAPPPPTDILSVMENYRQSTLSRLTAWCLWLGHLILHPTSAWRSSTLWHKVHLFFCYILSCISVGYHEKKTLLDWVRSRVKNYPVPDNFSSGWKDGILLCALLDSMYPGSCPRYDLLNADNCISNAQLAFFLLEKHTPIRPDITAEELAEGSPCIEKAVRAIVSRLKVISAKAQLQMALGKRPSIKDDAGDDSSSLVARKNCFAKGMGLILAVRGRKASFNVFTKSTSNFCIVVEIRGPDSTVCKEVITNRSPRRKVTARRPEADTSAPDGTGSDDKRILIEYDIQPGMVAVKYTPVLKGKHQLSIIWHGQHVAGSPFTVNVDDSTDYADELLLQRQDSTESQSSEKDDRLQTAPASPTSAAQLKGRIKRRRVLRRIVNVNGQDIVIEGDDRDKLHEVLRSLSASAKQNGSSFIPGGDKRVPSDTSRVAKPFFSPVSSPESSPETFSRVDYGHKSLWEGMKHGPSKLAMPEIVVSSFSQNASEEEQTPEVAEEASAPVNPCCSLSGRASPSGAVTPTGRTCLSGGASPCGGVTPTGLSGRASPCGRISPCGFDLQATEAEEPNDRSTRAPAVATHPAVMFFSDVLDQAETLKYVVSTPEPAASSPSPEELVAGVTAFIEAEATAVSADAADSCEAEICRKQLARTLSIISEESDKSPTDQVDPPESIDATDKKEASPSDKGSTAETEQETQQPPQATSNDPLDFKTAPRSSVLERARSLESYSLKTPPVQRQLSQSEPPSQQAPLSKLDELYLDTVKLKQFFAENFKTPAQTISPKDSFVPVGSGDEFVPVKDRVKVWEDRQSPYQSRSPELASPRGGESSSSVRQGTEKRFRVTPIAPPSFSKANEPDLVKDAILPQAGRRHAARQVDSAQGACSSQPSEDKEGRTVHILERDSLHLLSHQEKTEIVTRLAVHVCPLCATSVLARRSVNAGATRKTPSGFPITAHPSAVLTAVAMPDATSSTIDPQSKGGSGVGTGDPATAGSDAAANTARSTTRAVSSTLSALRHAERSPSSRESSRRCRRRQNECYRSPSYDFWFGSGHGDRHDLSDVNRKTSPSLLRRHPSMAAVRSDEDVSDEEDDEDGTEDEAGFEKGSWCSSCESGSAYIDDALNESSLMLESYASFELVRSSSEVVGSLYYDHGDQDPLGLFAESPSHPEKCVASGAWLYFGQVGAENHFQVSTKDAGTGPLSVSVQGPHAGSVIKVSVTYCGLGNYTVMYKVIEPGYYIIHIKWADWPIPDSPVMCKVTK
ncbi:hypothetical protein HPB48_010173 [Haemaphysalis longicornis]|uniref:Calponin-homology (CH) domain-containing protein n=1 Tax=Haemaphysalis longicornis TaxID=44386 RepID=A0A9J6FVV9_HAELO|nr:hypothetical protein HPB48_010173 [Haemaphysalis longicornis]